MTAIPNPGPAAGGAAVNVNVNSSGFSGLNQNINVTIRSLKELEKQTKAINQTLAGFNKLKSNITSTISSIAAIGGASIGFKSAMNSALDFSKTVVSLSSQFSKYGVGIGEVENRLESLAKTLRLTRADTAGFMSEMERQLPIQNFQQATKILVNIRNAVGSNTEAMKAMKSVVISLVDKFPELQKAVSRMADSDIQRIRNIKNILVMQGEMGMEQARMLEDYISQNRQASQIDKDRLNFHKKSIESMTDLKRQFEGIAISMGQKMLPYLKAFTDMLRENEGTFRAIAEVVGKLLPMFLAMKGLAFIGGAAGGMLQMAVGARGLASLSGVGSTGAAGAAGVGGAVAGRSLLGRANTFLSRSIQSGTKAAVTRVAGGALGATATRVAGNVAGKALGALPVIGEIAGAAYALYQGYEGIVKRNKILAEEDEAKSNAENLDKEITSQRLRGGRTSRFDMERDIARLEQNQNKRLHNKTDGAWNWLRDAGANIVGVSTHTEDVQRKLKQQTDKKKAEIEEKYAPKVLGESLDEARDLAKNISSSARNISNIKRRTGAGAGLNASNQFQDIANDAFNDLSKNKITDEDREKFRSALKGTKLEGQGLSVETFTREVDSSQQMSDIWHEIAKEHKDVESTITEIVGKNQKNIEANNKITESIANQNKLIDEHNKALSAMKTNFDAFADFAGTAGNYEAVASYAKDIRETSARQVELLLSQIKNVGEINQRYKDSEESVEKIRAKSAKNQADIQKIKNDSSKTDTEKNLKIAEINDKENENLETLKRQEQISTNILREKQANLDKVNQVAALEKSILDHFTKQVDSAKALLSLRQEITSQTESAFSKSVAAMAATGTFSQSEFNKMYGDVVSQIDSEIKALQDVAITADSAAKNLTVDAVTTFVEKNREALNRAGGEVTNQLKEWDRLDPEQKARNWQDFYASLTKMIRGSVEEKKKLKQDIFIREMQQGFSMMEKMASLTTEKWSKMNQIMSNFGGGIGPSVIVMYKEMESLGAQVELADKQILAYKEQINKEGANQIEIQATIAELENKKLDLISRQFQVTKSLREQWVNAIQAMSNAQGKYARIMIDANKNSKFALNHGMMITSSFSGNTRWGKDAKGNGEFNGQSFGQQVMADENGEIILHNPRYQRAYEIGYMAPRKTENAALDAIARGNSSDQAVRDNMDFYSQDLRRRAEHTGFGGDTYTMNGTFGASARIVGAMSRGEHTVIPPGYNRPYDPNRGVNVSRQVSGGNTGGSSASPISSAGTMIFDNMHARLVEIRDLIRSGSNNPSENGIAPAATPSPMPEGAPGDTGVSGESGMSGSYPSTASDLSRAPLDSLVDFASSALKHTSKISHPEGSIAERYEKSMDEQNRRTAEEDSEARQMSRAANAAIPFKAKNGRYTDDIKKEIKDLDGKIESFAPDGEYRKMVGENIFSEGKDKESTNFISSLKDMKEKRFGLNKELQSKEDDIREIKKKHFGELISGKPSDPYASENASKAEFYRLHPQFDPSKRDKADMDNQKKTYYAEMEKTSIESGVHGQVMGLYNPKGAPKRERLKHLDDRLKKLKARKDDDIDERLFREKWKKDYNESYDEYSAKSSFKYGMEDMRDTASGLLNKGFSALAYGKTPEQKEKEDKMKALVSESREEAKARAKAKGSSNYAPLFPMGAKTMGTHAADAGLWFAKNLKTMPDEPTASEGYSSSRKIEGGLAHVGAPSPISERDKLNQKRRDANSREFWDEKLGSGYKSGKKVDGGVESNNPELKYKTGLPYAGGIATAPQLMQSAANQTYSVNGLTLNVNGSDIKTLTDLFNILKDGVGKNQRMS